MITGPVECGSLGPGDVLGWLEQLTLGRANLRPRRGSYAQCRDLTLECSSLYPGCLVR